MLLSCCSITLLQIEKEDVDSYDPGTWIPKCQLSAVYLSDQQKISFLQHRVNLVGAKKPHTMITIELLVQKGKIMFM